LNLISVPTLLKQNYRTLFLVTVMMLAFYFCLKESYVLFHTVVELFSIIIAFAVFIVTWNSRKIMDNLYLYFVGISYAFIGILDLIHTLTFTGMNIISGQGFYANQFWVGTRFIEATTLVVGFYVMHRPKKPNADLIFGTYFIISLLLTLSILTWHIFPVCFISGVGQTPFKIFAEYLIIAILFFAGYLLYRHRERFSDNVYRYLICSLVFTILSEFCFTLYVSNYSAANEFGHYFKLIAFFLIYKANVETGFTEPTSLIFKDLQDSNNKLDESNHRLVMAMEAGALGSTVVTLKTGLMTSSEQFKRLFGRSANESFNYSDLFDAMLPQYRAEVETKVAHAMDNKSIYRAQYQISWPDGSNHWISAQGKARYNADDEAIQMIGIVSDITEIKAVEQRKDDFLSIASHELKTPVTSLKASLQFLNKIKEKPQTSTHIKLIEQANTSMEKMSLLIDDLLNVNRLTDGNLHLVPTDFNVYDMLAESCGHVRLEGKYELILTGDKNLIINADQARIEQVVVNFVNNAVKYAPDSEQIFLNIIPMDNMVKIAVRDTGPGINSSQIPYLFDRYYRVNHEGSFYSGLGLGLYICSEIVKKHGGTIGVESKIGQGSEFWFCLPLGTT
jgi:PAS domain S-box-containing protein